MKELRPITGNSPLERTLEELRRAILRFAPIAGRGIRLKQTPNGTVHEVLSMGGSGGSSGTEIKRFRVMSVSKEYVSCVEELDDGTLPDPLPEEEAWIKVAKPPEFRPSVFGSTSIGCATFADDSSTDAATRDVTLSKTFPGAGSATTINTSEMLKPPYVVHVEADAEASPPVTGVAGSTIWAVKAMGTSMLIDDIPVQWVDKNISGRQWGFAYDIVDACQAGSWTYLGSNMGTAES